MADVTVALKTSLHSPHVQGITLMLSNQAHQVAIKAAMAVLTAAVLAAALPIGASAQSRIIHSLRPAVKNQTPFLVKRVACTQQDSDDCGYACRGRPNYPGGYGACYNQCMESCRDD
jgi:hypothetical protein